VEVNLPEGYRLERDPDVLRLVAGEDGLLVAAFSARGATQEAVEETAREAYETAHQRRKAKPWAHFFRAPGSVGK
jgi:hypothetical protein